MLIELNFGSDIRLISNKIPRKLMQDRRLQEKGIAGEVSLYCGIGIILIVFLIQFWQLYDVKTFALTEEQQIVFNKFGLSTFGVIGGAIGLCLYGIHKLFDCWTEMGTESKNAIQKAKATVARSVRTRSDVFWLVICVYFVSFVFASGVLVIGAQNFSSKYGVAVPSYYVTGCCGQPGEFPVLSIYLSQNIGILLTPLDLILVIFLPLLVSVNVTTIVQRASNLGFKCRVSRDPSLYGASVGLMAGCPTCAASIFLASSATASIFGLSAATFTALQPAFLVISLGLLIASPVIAHLRK